MNNFIVRTITGVLFVAAVVTCFLNPRAMALFFALVTGLSIWEFCGLVNERPGVQVNRFISTVAGVYLFLAMAGYNSGITPSTVFIPYLVSIIYLMIAELYLKAKDPINNWAYTMMSQLYIALPVHLSGAPLRVRVPLGQRLGRLPVRLAAGQAQAVSAHLAGQVVGRQHRGWPARRADCRPGVVSYRAVRCQRPPSLCLRVGRPGLGNRRLRHLGRPHREPLQAHPRHQGQRQHPARSWRHARPLRLLADGHPRRRGLPLHAHPVLIKPVKRIPFSRICNRSVGFQIRLLRV